MKISLFIVLSLLSIHLPATTVWLSEKFLQEQVNLNPPPLNELNRRVLEAKSIQKRFAENFSIIGDSSISYLSSSVEPFSRFIPEVSTQKSANINITKLLKKGVQLTTGVYLNQNTHSLLYRGTTSGVKVGLNIDLYNNFLGRLTENRENSITGELKKSELSFQIGKKAFLQSIRKIYWSLVANNEALKISQKLLKTSKKQARVARQKLKKSIGDRGAVARHDSQSAARSSNIIYLKFIRENLYKQLKELLPSIKSNSLKLMKYDLNVTVKDVLICTALINRQLSIPYNFTKYDEFLNIATSKYNFDSTITNSYDGLEIKLNSEYHLIGKEYTLSNSAQDLSKNGRRQFQVAINLTIPLDNKKTDTKNTIAKKEREDYLREQQQVRAKLLSEHHLLKNSVDLLMQIMAKQQENNRLLAIVLKSSRKKYSQARITVRDLINDQDAYFSSSLNEIDTKLEIVTTLLNYLSVFTETPCSFNGEAYAKLN